MANVLIVGAIYKKGGTLTTFKLLDETITMKALNE